MTTPRELIAATEALTGITPHALARKLGVDAASLHAWRRGEGAPDGATVAALRRFHDAALASREARDAPPRVSTPEVREGLICGDAVETLRGLPTSSVDLIVSDIPYGIGQDDWDVLHPNTNSAYLGQSEAQRRAGAVFGKRRKPINGWSSADREIPRQYYAWCLRWAAEWLRVLKPGGSAFVFAGRRLAARCVVALEDAGFCVRDMLGWSRPRAVFRAQRLSTVLEKRGELGQAARLRGWRVGNLRPRFEPILWVFKPYERTVADNMLDYGVGALNVEAYERLSGSRDNHIHCGFEPGEGGQHQAQKPVRLLRALIELATPPGALVLDPFAGAGSTGIAAQRAGRRYLLVERDPRHCGVARRRLGLAPGSDGGQGSAATSGTSGAADTDR